MEQAYKVFENSGANFEAAQDIFLNYDNCKMVGRLNQDFEQRLKNLGLFHQHVINRNERIDDSYKEMVVSGAFQPKSIDYDKRMIQDSNVSVKIADDSIAGRLPTKSKFLWTYYEVMRVEDSKHWLVFETNISTWSNLMMFGKFWVPREVDFNDGIIEFTDNNAQVLYFNKYTSEDTLGKVWELKKMFNNLINNICKDPKIISGDATEEGSLDMARKIRQFLDIYLRISKEELSYVEMDIGLKKDTVENYIPYSKLRKNEYEDAVMNMARPGQLADPNAMIGDDQENAQPTEQAVKDWLERKRQEDTGETNMMFMAQNEGKSFVGAGNYSHNNNVKIIGATAYVAGKNMDTVKSFNRLSSENRVKGFTMEHEKPAMLKIEKEHNASEFDEHLGSGTAIEGFKLGDNNDDEMQEMNQKKTLYGNDGKGANLANQEDMDDLEDYEETGGDYWAQMGIDAEKRKQKQLKRIQKRANDKRFGKARFREGAYGGKNSSNNSQQQ